ncbi:hypothetical protein BASA60_008961 [Batrachochytrium salamandrivorans]|nr:hypothetical protein BASA60_008961 [Batrachochytrium salamandrivorans]
MAVGSARLFRCGFGRLCGLCISHHTNTCEPRHFGFSRRITLSLILSFFRVSLKPDECGFEYVSSSRQYSDRAAKEGGFILDPDNSRRFRRWNTPSVIQEGTHITSAIWLHGNEAWMKHLFICAIKAEFGRAGPTTPCPRRIWWDVLELESLCVVLATSNGGFVCRHIIMPELCRNVLDAAVAALMGALRNGMSCAMGCNMGFRIALQEGRRYGRSTHEEELLASSHISVVVDDKQNYLWDI